MFSKLLSAIAAIAFGGAFTSIGYLMYSGSPLESGSRKARLFMQAQNWLIENLGMSNAGLLIMAIGVFGGAYALYLAFSDDDEDE
ncbi:hypothetical protein [Thalassobius sp. I31.1]|uniref:hypothetical protein n=1 Tax=Thalassobius sp. I31.1 TaxID=2109912 RepID=UPI000D1A3965|nr:hypothetical protein [Thalassobius sp. I31.1]